MLKIFTDHMGQELGFSVYILIDELMISREDACSACVTVISVCPSPARKQYLHFFNVLQKFFLISLTWKEWNMAGISPE